MGMLIFPSNCHCEEALEEPTKQSRTIYVQFYDRDCHASWNLPRAKRGGSARNDSLPRIA